MLLDVHPGQATDVMISILMPVHNTPPDVLESAIRSVLCQTHQGWELCICDDNSTSMQTGDVLEKYRGLDPRIKIRRSEASLHIADATNAAAELATGVFVAFLDHDDTLEIDAIRAMVDAMAAHPDADLFYSDEDKIESDGSYSEPYLKPDWSPEHLASVMYILHFMVVRKSLFLDLGGLRAAFSGSQDYDLALRASRRARGIVHVPRVLYHWRKIAGSAAAALDAKPEALARGQQALASFVGDDGSVTPGLFPGSFRVRWRIERSVPVTLLILTNSRYRDVGGRGRILLVEHFVRSILDRTTYPELRIVVVDDGGMPREVRDSMRRSGVTVEHYAGPTPFNFSHKVNHALRFVQTEDVILLNDDLEVVAPDWVDALLEQSRRPGIGAVGARLLYPDGSLQHAGIVLGVNGGAAHLFYGWPSDRIGYCGFTHLVRNYSAVTAAVIATRMSVIRQVGGFDESLAIDFNDVDFCLRVGAAGLRVVYTPYATLYHFEGSSIARKTPNADDMRHFLDRWSSVLGNDPYYNPGLPRDRPDCHLDKW